MNYIGNIYEIGYMGKDIRSDVGAANIRVRSLLWISEVVRIIRHGHP